MLTVFEVKKRKSRFDGIVCPVARFLVNSSRHCRETRSQRSRMVLHRFFDKPTHRYDHRGGNRGFVEEALRGMRPTDPDCSSRLSVLQEGLHRGKTFRESFSMDHA